MGNHGEWGMGSGDGGWWMVDGVSANGEAELLWQAASEQTLMVTGTGGNKNLDEKIVHLCNRGLAVSCVALRPGSSVGRAED